MLTPRQTKVAAVLGIAAAIAFGFPFINNAVTALPRSRVANCKVVVSHTYFLHVKLDSGSELVLQGQDVPDPAHCLATGTEVEKVRGELGYRLNGRRYFWQSEQRRTFAAVAVAGLLVALGSVVLLRGAQRES